jgi:hypothetical protein
MRQQMKIGDVLIGTDYEKDYSIGLLHPEWVRAFDDPTSPKPDPEVPQYLWQTRRVRVKDIVRRGETIGYSYTRQTRNARMVEYVPVDENTGEELTVPDGYPEKGRREFVVKARGLKRPWNETAAERQRANEHERAYNDVAGPLVAALDHVGIATTVGKTWKGTRGVDFTLTYEQARKLTEVLDQC